MDHRAAFMTCLNHLIEAWRSGDRTSVETQACLIRVASYAGLMLADFRDPDHKQVIGAPQHERDDIQAKCEEFLSLAEIEVPAATAASGDVLFTVLLPMLLRMILEKYL
jgi:hypothetical protein